MTPRSRLHVPAPPARPGQDPDFSYVQISPAGAVSRPDVTASVRDIENLARERVRVLEEEHRAVGPWDPGLEASELQVGLRHMLLTRLFDDRMQKIQRQGVSPSISSPPAKRRWRSRRAWPCSRGTCCSPR